MNKYKKLNYKIYTVLMILAVLFLIVSRQIPVLYAHTPKYPFFFIVVRLILIILIF
ncbi:Uncharacterized protein dnl_30110 [Desulfonema limicola]|uniref:Uncharacterized protein n=1 Tax=Desulfonema limicola TaxID=45656 RepID=A0A975GGV5_9BACT|nr:Uncharacterized protein dnl_30110 [Desulfonema limicola]